MCFPFCVQESVEKAQAPSLRWQALVWWMAMPRSLGASVRQRGIAIHHTSACHLHDAH